MTLDQLSRGEEGRVASIDGGFGLRRHLEALGLHAGDAVKVIQASALRGPVLIETGGRRLAIGRGVAIRVLVEPGVSAHREEEPR